MQRMIFIAKLIACSTCFGHHYAHHQGLKYRWLLLVVFGALVFKLSVWRGAVGCVSGLRTLYVCVYMYVCMYVSMYVYAADSAPLAVPRFRSSARPAARLVHLF